MRFMKPAAATLIVALAATAIAPTADARDRHFYRHGGYHHHHNGGAAFGAGVAGFAAGAILGSLAQPRYYDEAPGYYYRQPSYYYAPEPVYVTPAPRAYYNGGYNRCGNGTVSRPANSLC